MEDLESRIREVLGDPAQMEQVFSVARSLGITPPSDEKSQPDAAPAELGSLAELIRQAAAVDPRENALLSALKPYCSADRQRRIDRALRIARISQIAGAALKSIDRRD